MRLPTWLRPGLLAVALLLPLSLSPPASACPNCKDALAVQDAGGGPDSVAPSGLSAGFSRSILLMLAMPFTLLGLGTFAVVRMAKKGTIPQL